MTNNKPKIHFDIEFKKVRVDDKEADIVVKGTTLDAITVEITDGDLLEELQYANFEQHIVYVTYVMGTKKACIDSAILLADRAVATMQITLKPAR